MAFAKMNAYHKNAFHTSTFPVKCNCPEFFFVTFWRLQWLPGNNTQTSNYHTENEKLSVFVLPK